jgi:putative hydrolase of the HAD superfamily
VLRSLHRRQIGTAVLSDCTHELPALVPGLPVGPLLDAQVYSIEVGACKPDPSIYLEACARLAVDPQECLYIGDGSSKELTGASRVGMRAIRLDAPDLVDHLYLNRDEGWVGRTARSLAEAVAPLDRTLAAV